MLGPALNRVTGRILVSLIVPDVALVPLASQAPALPLVVTGASLGGGRVTNRCFAPTLCIVFPSFVPVVTGPGFDGVLVLSSAIGVCCGR